MCTKCCCSNCAATCQKCPLGVKPDANQTVNVILGLGGEAFKWVFNMNDKCYIPSLIRLVEKAMKKAHRPVWRPVGPMAVPTFTTKLPLAMKRGRTRRPCQRKLRETADACRQEGLVFLPFAMETLGGLHAGAVTQVKKIAAALARSKGLQEGEVTSQLFGRLSLTLMRGNALMLSSRCQEDSLVPTHVDGVM